MKVKAAKDFETMRNDLTVRSTQELEALRQKYEAMLEEMRRNGNADKEFVANELRKRIQELERQIDEMRENFS